MFLKGSLTEHLINDGCLVFEPCSDFNQPTIHFIFFSWWLVMIFPISMVDDGRQIGKIKTHEPDCSSCQGQKQLWYYCVHSAHVNSSHQCDSVFQTDLHHKTPQVSLASCPLVTCVRLSWPRQIDRHRIDQAGVSRAQSGPNFCPNVIFREHKMRNHSHNSVREFLEQGNN